MLPKDKLVAAATGITSPGCVCIEDASLHRLVRSLGSGIAQKVKKPDHLEAMLSLGRTVRFVIRENSCVPTAASSSICLLQVVVSKRVRLWTAQTGFQFLLR